MNKPTVTITQIAQRASVSRGTVDKVLHDRPGVSDHVRSQVKAVIQELNYRPNPVARALRSTGKPIRVAVIIPRADNPFFEKVKAGMDETLPSYAPYGLEAEYYFCDAIDPREIAALLEHVRTDGIDGVAMRATNHEMLRQKIDDMAASGIPVVLYDSDISNTKALCYVGENPMKAGRMAGSLMATAVGEQGDVAVIHGISDFTVHESRLRGFREVVESFPGIRIVRVGHALEQQEIAYREAASILDEFPDLRGVYVVAGRTWDICRAIVERNRQGKVKVVCYNGTRELVPYVRDRTISFAISTEPHLQGEYALRVLFDYLFHDRAPDERHLETPLSIAMDQNAE